MRPWCKDGARMVRPWCEEGAEMDRCLGKLKAGQWKQNSTNFRTIQRNAKHKKPISISNRDESYLCCRLKWQIREIRYRWAIRKTFPANPPPRTIRWLCVFWRRFSWKRKPRESGWNCDRWVFFINFTQTSKLGKDWRGKNDRSRFWRIPFILKGYFERIGSYGTISTVMHTFIEQTAKQTKREHKNRWSGAIS